MSILHSHQSDGFGFIEVGTVTNQPQPGNPKLRIFRLPRDGALINRLGFNNCGAAQLAENIRRHRPDCVLGINIGKSGDLAIEDAVASVCCASFQRRFVLRWQMSPEENSKFHGFAALRPWF